MVKVTGGKKYEGVLNQLQSLKKGVKAGILKGATTVDGQSIAEYAAYNEYGTQYIPSRPFMRQTAKESSDNWAKCIAVSVKGRSSDRNAWNRGITLAGELMKGDIKTQIQKGNFEPLAKNTIRQKQAKGKPEPEKTLVDTGQMLSAIAYEVTQ